MRKRGRLFVVSAPSGSGKTTLCDRLLKEASGRRKLVNSVSATTRRARKGEQEGEDYYFLSRRDFLKKRKAGKFLEWAEVLNNYYGTPREFIARHTEEGNDVLLNIDVQGALKIKRMLRGQPRKKLRSPSRNKTHFKAIFIFILPPSFEELERRLRLRSTETEKEIIRRLVLARKEMSPRFLKEYDYVIVNDTIKKSVEKLKKIIKYERGG